MKWGFMSLILYMINYSHVCKVVSLGNNAPSGNVCQIVHVDFMLMYINKVHFRMLLKKYFYQKKIAMHAYSYLYSGSLLVFFFLYLGTITGEILEKEMATHSGIA